VTFLVNVWTGPVPLDSGNVLGPGEWSEVKRVGKGDGHYIDLERLVERDSAPAAQPAGDDVVEMTGPGDEAPDTSSEAVTPPSEVTSPTPDAAPAPAKAAPKKATGHRRSTTTEGASA
jgi:hypothetical protein